MSISQFPDPKSFPGTVRPPTSLSAVANTQRPHRFARLYSMPVRISEQPQPGSLRGDHLVKAVASVLALVAAGAVGYGVSKLDPSKSAWKANHPVRTVGAPVLKPAGNGSHVRWHGDTVHLVLDDSLKQIAPQAPEKVADALAAWRASGAPLPSVSTTPGSGKQVGYTPGGENENVVVFAPAGWEKAKGALGITLLTYNTDTGALLDADILFNGGGRYFGLLEPVAQPVAAANPTTIEHGAGQSDDAVSDETDDNGSSSAKVKGSAKTKTTVVATPVDDRIPNEARFDFQSVLTHEVGHMFGLGEDYDDVTATMYVSTAPGETHKRVLKPSDGEVVAALYREAVADDSSVAGKTGCGGATIAGHTSSAGPPLAWFAVGVAALGLGLLARRRSSAFAVWVGGGLTIAGALSVLTPPSIPVVSDNYGTVRRDARAQIVQAAPHWSDGVLETELTVRINTCHVAGCEPGEHRISVHGGRMGNVAQVVGLSPVPEVGEEVEVALQGARRGLSVLYPVQRR